MSNSCPLNFKKVDENISRINAFIVSTLVVGYVYSFNIYILLFLFGDFVMKLFFPKLTSPILTLSTYIQKMFHLSNHFVDGGAKRLAGFFGLFFIVFLGVTHFFDSLFLTYTIAIIFLTCSLLDVFFSFCIGCKIYFIIKKMYPNFINNL